MLGLWLDEGRLELRDDLPLPTLIEGEALVRVLRAGICNTDLELVRGYYPYSGILGHEFVGVVEDGPRDLWDRRVVGEINASCHRCPTCRAGRPHHCPHRTVLGIQGRNGAFAEYLVLPTRNLLPVPPTVSSDAATFVEPLAAALEIREQVSIRPSDRVLVLGPGKLGQLVARSLAPTGCHLTASGRSERTLRLLAPHGIQTVPPEAIEPDSFDVVVECTGHPEGFEIARSAVRPAGTLVLKSTYADDLTLDASALVVDEITLVGSRCGPFAPALRLLAEGTIRVDELVDARFSLEAGLEGFARAERPGTLKVILEIGEP